MKNQNALFKDDDSFNEDAELENAGLDPDNYDF